jgi:hypothetical protein
VRRFWPAAEAAQADYEALRAAVIAGTIPVGPAAVRFERLGLAGLIRHPASEPVFAAQLIGAGRPHWSPHADPRLLALAQGYALLVADRASDPELREVRR